MEWIVTDMLLCGMGRHSALCHIEPSTTSMRVIPQVPTFICTLASEFGLQVSKAKARKTFPQNRVIANDIGLRKSKSGSISMV